MSLFDRMFPPAAAPESPPGTVDGASNYGTPASEVPVPTPGSLLMAIASMPVDPPPALVTQRVKQQLHAAKQDVTTYAQAASEFHLELSDPTKPWDFGPLVFLACIQGRYHLCHSLVAAPPVIYRGPYFNKFVLFLGEHPLDSPPNNMGSLDPALFLAPRPRVLADVPGDLDA